MSEAPAAVLARIAGGVLLAAGLLLLAALLALGGRPAHAQAVPCTGPNQGNCLAVQQNATDARAATQVQSSATSAATLTFTPAAGQSVYVTALDITNCAGASAVTAAAPTTVTTTNITGSPAWTVGSGTTAGACQPTIQQQFPAGLKSTTPGTPVTFVLPTFATNQTIRMNAYAYFAP